MYLYLPTWLRFVLHTFYHIFTFNDVFFIFILIFVFMRGDGSWAILVGHCISPPRSKKLFVKGGHTSDVDALCNRPHADGDCTVARVDLSYNIGALCWALHFCSSMSFKEDLISNVVFMRKTFLVFVIVIFIN